MRRRAFLKLLAGGGAVVAGAGLLFRFGKRSPAASRLFPPDEARFLAALLPLDVPLEELEKKLDAERVEFYRAGLGHLRPQRPGFADDPPAEQARFVAGLIEKDELGFQFLTQLAHDAAEVHYATPEGRASIGYAGPPQFRGFPEFQGPP